MTALSRSRNSRYFSLSRAAGSAGGCPGVGELPADLVHPGDPQSLRHRPDHQSVNKMRCGVEDAGPELQRHLQQFLGLLLQARVQGRRQPRREQAPVATPSTTSLVLGQELSHLHGVGNEPNESSLT